MGSDGLLTKYIETPFPEAFQAFFLKSLSSISSVELIHTCITWSTRLVNMRFTSTAGTLVLGAAVVLAKELPKDELKAGMKLPILYWELAGD
jgi:hypothetical protein